VARILIDGTMARTGGGHTYLANLVPELSKHPSHEFLVLVRSPRLASVFEPPPNVELRQLPEVGWSGQMRFTYREAAGIAGSWGADVFFSAGEYAPASAPCPTVAAFRNPNVFTRLRQGWPARQQVRLRVLRELARLSARSCDRILFVSEDSAQWIGDRIGLPQERRAVVHHGIDPARWRDDGSPSPHPRPYVLSVSSVYRYKNFVRLIEAWALLRDQVHELPDLVIIGDVQDAAHLEAMQKARAATGSLADRVHVLGEVPYEQIARWYGHAGLFAFPSYLETFGHPLLEAMASHVPVVAGDVAVSREIAGDAALYADPYDPEALARALAVGWNDESGRDTLVKRGQERIRQFGWDRSARGLVELLETLVAEVPTARLQAHATSLLAR